VNARLLRIEEVSAETGIPVDTLRYWRKQGRGPRFERVGRRLVCRSTDLKAWVDAQFAQAS
jgi:DNA-binding transcriptional MerR regulator